MAKSNKKSDIITLEAEEVGNSGLERQIEVALQKENVTDKVIAALKEKYGGLRLRNVEDKEMFLEISASRKEVRKIGILAERICEEGRSDAIKIQRLWLAKQKEVLGKIAEVQDPLDAEIKKYEDEIERKEQEEIRKKENAFAARQSQLIKMGATYLDGHYTLDHVSFDSTLVKESDDDVWAGMLSKYQAQYEKNEAAKIEEERKREAAAEALRVQQAEMDRQRREFEAQQAEFKKHQDELQRQKDEAERVQREAAHREQLFKAQQEEKLWRGRLAELVDIGWNGQFAFDRADDDAPVLTYEELIGISDTHFADVRDAYNKKIALRKEQQRVENERVAKELAEKKELERQEQVRAAEIAAAQRERDRILEENRQQKMREEQEVARLAEEALKASDKQKWQAYIVYHTGGVVPEMKSPSYRAKMAEAQKLMQKIINL